MIIPSIDIMNGKAVQLCQGRQKVLEADDPISLAREFCRYGDLAVIDLDAAMGKGENARLIQEICRRFPCRVGGGIRSIQRANEFLSAGAKKIIIGTRAERYFLQNFPRERVIVAVDSKDGKIVKRGWRNKTRKKPSEAIRELENYCSEFLYTNVNKEGMMQGCDLNEAVRLSGITSNKLTIAGGITAIEEVKALEAAGMNSQLGMAIYTGKMRLDDAFISVLDFQKNNGIIPTIVQDARGQVLMLAYSSMESLRESLTSGRACYYSRSKKRIWTKGETSGNFQQLLRVRYDCDRDTILFLVNQKNAACHTGKYSCFGEKEFSLDELYSVIEQRILSPVPGSYTSRLAKDESFIMEKIREESDEVVCYKDRQNLAWEIADLAYFVMVLMAKKGIPLSEVRDELWRRRK